MKALSVAEHLKNELSYLNKYLPAGRRVFEIGAGEGLDSLQLQKVGYKVLASDYVDEFVQILKNKGLDAMQFDAKNDELPTPADCIYSNAVFVHFYPEEISDFLKRAKRKLINEKIIFLSALKGEGYERSARSRGFKRDFYYYSSQSLRKILTAHRFTILDINDNDSKWVQIIARAG